MLRELRDPRNAWNPSERHVLISLVNLYLGGDLQYLNFYGPPRSIGTVPYHQIVRYSDPMDSANPAYLNGKAAFVGFSESAQPKQKDNYHTVFSDELSGLDLSGVEIAATAFANLLEDRPLRRLEAPAHLGIVFLFGLAAGVVCLYFSITVAAICTIALMLLYLGAAVHLFTAGGIWLPLVVPLCLQAPVAFVYAALCKYRDANRERQNIRRAFEYYLPSSVVDQLAKKLGPVTSENQLVYGTCLATDVERYTAVAEKMDPVQLTRLMNDYYQRVFRPVQQFGGIVSDIEGDAVLAIWAAANPSAELKHRACQASLGIACAVVEFNQTSGRPALRTRIGLDSGSMSIGSVGGGSHYEYRAVGDIVNTAHRIQGLNKRLGTQILASEATLDGVEGFLRRWLGSFLLEGKSRALRVFELLCPNQKANSDQRWLCSAFSDALNRYRAQQWQKASKQFLEILRLFPEDGPTQYYLKLSEQYKIHPPSLAAWNEGVVLIEGK
jgi:adenylate cyclase